MQKSSSNQQISGGVEQIRLPAALFMTGFQIRVF
jgi:hypothetical protein